MKRRGNIPSSFYLGWGESGWMLATALFFSRSYEPFEQDSVDILVSISTFAFSSGTDLFLAFPPFLLLFFFSRTWH